MTGVRCPTLPALILGTGITVLGTIRSLARAGIDAICLSRSPGVERHSRWYRSIRPSETLIEDCDLETYLDGISFKEGVLIPCTDHWSEAVSRVSPNERFHLCTSRESTQVSLTDKGLFESLLTRYLVPHPRTLHISDPHDVDSIAQKTPLSDFFLKPRDSQAFFRRFQKKAFLVTSAEECKTMVTEALSADLELVLQEYIPGPPNNHYYIEGFINRNGKVRALFARQRLRMYPELFGNSTYMVSVPLEDVAGASHSLLSLLKQIQYRGIFSAEFKLDPRDGLFKLLEVNARPWWYIEFATQCGVNVAAMAYYDALEMDFESEQQYLIGVRSVNLYTDWQVFQKDFRGGKVKLVEYLHPWIFAYYTVFSWRDPKPGLAWSQTAVTQKIKNVFSRPLAEQIS